MGTAAKGISGFRVIEVTFRLCLSPKVGPSGVRLMGEKVKGDLWREGLGSTPARGARLGAGAPESRTGGESAFSEGRLPAGFHATGPELGDGSQGRRIRESSHEGCQRRQLRRTGVRVLWGGDTCRRGGGRGWLLRLHPRSARRTGCTQPGGECEETGEWGESRRGPSALGSAVGVTC